MLFMRSALDLSFVILLTSVWFDRRAPHPAFSRLQVRYCTWSSFVGVASDVIYVLDPRGTVGAIGFALTLSLIFLNAIVVTVHTARRIIRRSIRH